MKLGLSRGDFNIHSMQTFQNLFKDDDLSDVTLVCEDNKQIKAHKVILSAGSQFFRDVFLQHPVALLYLRLEYEHLVSLVRFIYLGQCEVEQRDIESFLLIAKELKVGGLCDENEKEIHKGENYVEKHELYEDICDFQIPLEDSFEDNSKLKAFSANDKEFEDKNIDFKEKFNFETVLNDSDELKSRYICPMCKQNFEHLATLKIHMEDNHQEPESKSDKQILSDRKRHFVLFEDYVKDHTKKNILDVLGNDGGKDNLVELIFGFLSSYRKKDNIKKHKEGERPNSKYLQRMRSNIRRTLMVDYKLDLCCMDQEQKARWKEIVPDF